MTPLELILAAISGARKCGEGWSARCPAHDDRRASLSIAEGNDGRVLLKCHAGCSVESITSAIGMTVNNLMPERNESSTPSRKHLNGKPAGRSFATFHDAVAALECRHGKPTNLWTYRDLNGDPVGVVVRWDGTDGKEIRPVSKFPDGWRIAAMLEPRPLYDLPDLANASRVIVCEGEKSAQKAIALGFTATTSAGGSQAASKTDWSPLANKEVWIFPDNDAPGRKYAEDVVKTLSKLSPSSTLKIIDLPDLPEHGDIVDWIDAHGDAAEPNGLRAELEKLAESVKPIAPRVPAKRYDTIAFQSFPVDVLPEPVRSFVVNAAKAMGCDPSYLVLPLLTVLASAIGNTRRLEIKRGWSVPPILWTAFVGESGTVKSPAYELVMKPIQERQKKAMKRHDSAMQEYEAELARWEKKMSEWKREKNKADDPPTKPEPPAAQRYVVSDTTVEALAPLLLTNPRGLLLARDELKSWFGSFDRYAGKGKAGGDAANWLSMFSASNLIVDRKTGSARTIYVPRAAICVTGGIQPKILKRALAEEHRESGLAARLLLAYPPRKPKKWTEADIEPAEEAKLSRLVDRLFELQSDMSENGDSQPVLVRLTVEAKSEWVAYFNAHGQEQVELTGDIAAAWSKLEEYAARLAMVIHFVRWAANDPTLTHSDAVDADSMRAGITLTKWFKHEARRVYAMLDETDSECGDRRLIEWIERKGGRVTAREAQQGCRWLKNSDEAAAALKALESAGLGSWEVVPATAIGGRPTDIFVLSTGSTSTNPPQSSRVINVS